MRNCNPGIPYLRALTRRARNLYCYKVLSEEMSYVRCTTCEVVDDAVYCIPCFLRGNHEGHDWALVRGNESVCDCGDVTALTYGCQKHRVYGNEVYWKFLFSIYNDTELVYLSQLVKYYADSEFFLRYVGSENSQLLTELFVFGRYAARDAMISRDFDVVMQHMISGNLRGLLYDVLYQEDIRQLVPTSSLIKSLFFRAIYCNFDLVYGITSDFFYSLEICQLLSYSCAFNYVYNPKAAFFAYLIDFYRKSFTSESSMQHYEQLFRTRFGLLAEFQVIAHDSDEFLQAFCRFCDTVLSWKVTPALKYENFERYIYEFHFYIAYNTECIVSYYEIANAISCERHELSFYEGLLAKLFAFQNEYCTRHNTTERFELFPNYMLQRYMVGMQRTFGVSFSQILAEIIKIDSSIDARHFHMYNLSDFLHIFKFVFTIEWSFWPRNQEDNLFISHGLCVDFPFNQYYDIMCRYCVNALLGLEMDIVGFLEQFNSSIPPYAYRLVMMYILMMCLFPLDPSITQLEQFIFYFFCHDAQFSINIRDLSDLLYYNRQKEFMPVLNRYCKQIRQDYKSNVYCLDDFTKVNIFQYIEWHSYSMVNYSIMRGKTELLPCVANYRALVNADNLATVKAHTNVRQLLELILSAPDPHYDLYTYTSIIILTDLLLDRDPNIIAQVREYINDDHISLLLDGCIKDSRQETKNTIAQRMMKLKERLGSANSTNTLLIQTVQMPKIDLSLAKDQEICGQCHQPLDYYSTVCLYSYLAQELNILPYALLITCKHKFHRQCAHFGMICPICYRHSAFYMYHIERQEYDSVQFSKDQKLIYYIERAQINFQDVYEQQKQLINEYLCIEMSDLHWQQLLTFLKDQIYILRQLALQRIIKVADSSMEQLLPETFNINTYFQQQRAMNEKAGSLVSVVRAMPKDSGEILRILMNGKCSICAYTLGMHEPAGCCLKCGKVLHFECVESKPCCQMSARAPFYLDFSDMTIKTAIVEVLFRAPYRSRTGDIPSSLYGECLEFNQSMLDFIICQIVTGAVYTEEQGDNDLLVQDSEEEYEELSEL